MVSRQKKNLLFLFLISYFSGFFIYFCIYEIGFTASVYYALTQFVGDIQRPSNVDLKNINIAYFWLIYLSGLIAFFTTVYAFIITFLKDWVEKITLEKLTKDGDYSIIFGLGNAGYTLAKDMLKKQKEFVIVEIDSTNSFIEKIKSKGALVIVGDATSKQTLEKVNIENAKDIICLTGKDSVNLEIVIKISNEIKDKEKLSKTFIHLDNRENYELLREETLSIFTNYFNLYDNAAHTLFMKYPLGNNIFNTIEDLDNESKIVKLAIIGFDKVGESILYKALNLGYFYNEKPIEITIFDENSERKIQEFEKNYLLDMNNEYWKIEFEQISEFYKKECLNFTQVVFCSIDIEESYSDAMRLMKTKIKQIKDKNIEIYLFVDINENIANLLDKNTDIFKNLHVFGSLKDICSYDVITKTSLDSMAKKSNARYNELHGYDIEDGNKIELEKQWNKLNTFQKDSNRFQVEHLPIKLQIINLFLEKNKYQGRYEDIKNISQTKWFKYKTRIIWDELKDSKILVEYLPQNVLERIAIVEHRRWNALHILNGWKQLKIASDTKDKIKKDEENKLHPCLVPWEELDNISKNHKHDYKSDDIESVIRVSDTISDITHDENGLEKCYMKKILAEYIKNIKKGRYAK